MNVFSTRTYAEQCTRSAFYDDRVTAEPLRKGYARGQRVMDWTDELTSWRRIKSLGSP